MDSLTNYHPIIVHFPIALLCVAVVTQLISILFYCRKKSLILFGFINFEFLFKFTLILLLLGVIGAYFSIITGSQAEDDFKKSSLAASEKYEEIHELLEEHESAATATMVLFSFALVLKFFFFLKYVLPSNKDTISLLLYFVITLLIISGGYYLYKTGFYGGELVYRYGVGFFK